MSQTYLAQSLKIFVEQGLTMVSNPFFDGAIVADYTKKKAEAKSDPGF